MDDALREVIVAKKTEEAHNMASFELVDPAGSELPAFSPGAHVDVTLPGGLVRQYSLCNSATERPRYVIGVWNDANSRGGSKALHTQVNVGDKLQVGLPRNRFRAPRQTKRAILMARGIGVTPILSIADHLKRQDIPFELHYVYAMMSPGSFSEMIATSNFADDTNYYYEASERDQLLNSRRSPAGPAGRHAAFHLWR